MAGKGANRRTKPAHCRMARQSGGSLKTIADFASSCFRAAEDWGYGQLAVYALLRTTEREISRHIFGQALISVLLGLAFLLAQYASVGNRTFADWSWFLGLLIGTMMLCLYVATFTLHALLSRMATYSEHGSRACHDCLKHTLSDRNFVVAGASFGVLNCVLGYSFGLPYTNAPAVVSILLGYFLVGFVGGMGVLGIYGVFVAISAFSRDLKSALDITSPDNCGGTQFIGEALVVFSSVTLIAGVMISIYIVGTHWSGQSCWLGRRHAVFLDHFSVRHVLDHFVCARHSAAHRVAPVQAGTREHFRNRLAAIRQSLENPQLDRINRKELRDDYEFGQSARRELSPNAIMALRHERGLKISHHLDRQFDCDLQHPLRLGQILDDLDWQ